MERLVVVANRLPVQRSKKDSAGGKWEISPGGLVSALTPLVQFQNGAWIGWGGSSGANPESFSFQGIKLKSVDISAKELDSFYYGFCNSTLWPLYHDSVRSPEFNREWWAYYKQVNLHFAEKTLRTTKEDDLIWIHDYQLQLVPGLIRRMRPKQRIGFFLHIPFPPEELFAQLPWRKQILEGLLGANVVGFQTQLSAYNFARAARKYTDAIGSLSHLKLKGHDCRVKAYPISIDVKKIEHIASKRSTLARADQFRRSVGNRKIILGVDRLDYTKGIDIRLKAVETLLETKRLSIDDFVFIQIVVPSREKVIRYQDMKVQIETMVGRINGDFGEPGRFPIHYIHRSFPTDQLIGIYSAADVMLVTPLCDGMNLVSKEYVTSQVQTTGVLILSEFAGAAIELKEAVLVNPHDVDGVAGAIEFALRLPIAEAKRRMKKLQKAVRRNDVHHWARRFMKDLKN